MGNDICLYVHIPFCSTKCDYCDFCSFDNCNKDLKDKYFFALINEISSYAQFLKNTKIKSVYIGGGTPNSVKSSYIDKILTTIKQNYNIIDDAEISIECNPNFITSNLLDEYYGYGINRISVGIQSLNNKSLKSINRKSNKKININALKLLNKSKFKNYNVDYMIALPHQHMYHVKHDIKKIANFSPTHISCYGLILEPETRLFDQVKNGNIMLPDEIICDKLFDVAFNSLKKLGYKRYEVSAYCKNGYECVHNINYWNSGNYIGFGLNAHSYMHNIRYENVADINEYIKLNSLDLLIDNKLTHNRNDILNANIIRKLVNNNEQLNKFIKNNHKNAEIISNKEKKEEYIMLKLRMNEGLDICEFSKKFKENIMNTKRNNIEKLVKNGLLEVKNNHISATYKGFKLLNQIILELI